MGQEQGYKVNDCLNRPVMAVNKTRTDGVGAFVERKQNDAGRGGGTASCMNMYEYESGQRTESMDHLFARLVFFSSGALVTSLLHHHEAADADAGVCVCVCDTAV